MQTKKQPTALERTIAAARAARQQTYQATLVLGRSGLTAGKVSS